MNDLVSGDRVVAFINDIDDKFCWQVEAKLAENLYRAHSLQNSELQFKTFKPVFFLKEIRDSLGDELEMQPLTRAGEWNVCLLHVPVAEISAV